jgi:putative salt-induced outer membrane protein YdiY
MRNPRAILVIALTSLPALFARVRAEEATAASNPLKATVNVGYVQTGGNTDVVTMLASDKLAWKTGSWVYTQDGEAVYGKNQGTENAGRYNFGLRADDGLSARMSLYGLSSYKRNIYGGVEHQFDEGVGAVYHAILPKPQLLDLELGFGLLQRRTTVPTDENFSTARVAALYKYFFAGKATFEASSDWVVDLQDTDNSDVEAIAKLAAPLAGGLSLNLGYDAQYRSKPLPGLERLDWTVSTGLQLNY